MSTRTGQGRPLAGRSALVTGGSRGIGRAICLGFADGGATVGFCHPGETGPAAATLAALRERGGTHAEWRCDVTSEPDVIALFDAFVERFGVPDIVVANAGILRAAPLVDTSVEDFDAVIAVNLRGTFLVAREAARWMSTRPAPDGAPPRRIITLASELARNGRAGLHAYCASKGGIVSMTRSLARELAPHVLVNAIAPGPIATDMTAPDRTDEAERAQDLANPLGRYGEPEDIAATATFLAGDGARFVTGQCFGIDGGSSMA